MQCAIVRVRVDGRIIKAQAGHPDVVCVVSAVILQPISGPRKVIMR